MNTYFASCFNSVIVPSTHSLSSQHYLSIETLDLTHQEVQNILLRTKLHSASGPDGISSWMLKTFAVEIAPFLTSLFNLSIRTGQLPAEWKSSNIVPIPKDSTPQDVQSFHPISLLPIISKILEKNLHQFLPDHLITNNILSENQCGFCSRQSTMILLLLATHHWHTILEKHSQVGCIFFNLSKTFDTRTCLISFNFSEFQPPSSTGLSTTYLVDTIELSYMALILSGYLLAPVFLRVLSWGHSCSLYIQMT